MKIHHQMVNLPVIEIKYLTLEIRGELREFAPLLKLGEKLNVGKRTAFGLEKYQVA